MPTLQSTWTTRTGLARPLQIGCCVVILIHVVLLAWLSVTDSPVPDEVKQIPAGLRNWRGEYALYRVTPPLVRYIANVPLLFADKEIDWQDYPARTYNRQETNIGREFIESNGMSSFWWYTYGRWLCIPWSVLGGLVCFHWCRKLYGDTAGFITLVVWCFSPMIIAHGHYITTDMAVTALGALASYWYWKWLRSGEMADAFSSGVLLGLAILAKSTCIIFFAFWPLCLILYWVFHREIQWRERAACRLMHLASAFFLAVTVINAGYLFTGSFRSLGSYTFKSEALAGEDAACHGKGGGNRFRGTVLEQVPVPLPGDFVQGVDWQKADFEKKRKASYLLGQNRNVGWWWYYIVGLVVKEPLGIWLLWLMAVFVRVYYYPPEAARARGPAARAPVDDDQSADAAADARAATDRTANDEWFLWAMAIFIFAFISSQTGLSRHTRYVMPAIPFLYILAGSVAAWFSPRRRALALCTVVAVIWLVASSLLTFPYSLAYFNELIGSPRNANRYLTGSNIDWGQDMFRLRQWIASHPEARPILYHGNHTRFDLRMIGIAKEGVPGVPRSVSDLTPEELATVGPQPGWFAMSVNYLTPDNSAYRYLTEIEPVAEIGRTTRIFHLTLADANRLRRRYSLPPLPTGPDAATPETKPPATDAADSDVVAAGDTVNSSDRSNRGDGPPEA